MSQNISSSEKALNFSSNVFASVLEQSSKFPLDLNELLVKNPPATFFMRVSGDAMHNAGIQDGDIVVVNRNYDAFDGAIVVATLNNEFLIRFFQKDSSGIILTPANTCYPQIELGVADELKIFGVVSAVIHQFIK